MTFSRALTLHLFPGTSPQKQWSNSSIRLLADLSSELSFVYDLYTSFITDNTIYNKKDHDGKSTVFGSNYITDSFEQRVLSRAKHCPEC